MIVADTSAILALLDSAARAHADVVRLFRNYRSEWVLPWAILPELDHVVPNRLGPLAASAFRADLAEGRYDIAWGRAEDLRRAHELHVRYRDLDIGLVDCAVMAVAERLGARAIMTLDLRDFGAVELRGRPAIWPREL